MTFSPDDPMYKPEEAAVYVGGIQPQTMAVWRSKRKGPAFTRVGGCIRYRKSALDRWLDSQTVDPA